MNVLNVVKTTGDMVRRKVSEEEWQTRVDLAAFYRLMPIYGMSDLVYNHITARIPGTEDVLINPYGMLYDEITASSLIRINLLGDVLFNPNDEYGVNRAGYVIHSAVHIARPDVACVVHTHSRAGMAVSALKEGLLPLTQTAMRFSGHTAYHDYEGPAVDEAERGRLVQDLGDRNVMILRNHGLLAAGEDIPQTFNTMYWLEMACRAQVDALACQRELVIPQDDVISKTARLYQPDVRRPFGVMEWPAMLRFLDRRDASFRN